jgi:hypothetical protein
MLNKYRKHVLVLPEDDANRQLANGFLSEVDQPRMQILPEAGGWLRVCEAFLFQHVGAMRKYPQRHVVLLLDFDEDQTRLEKVKMSVPEDLRDRVFLLGVWSEPEALKQEGLGSYERIGRLMAQDCRNRVSGVWHHQLLHHNAGELARLDQAVRDSLFL